jgi:hypothetical protein
LRRGDDDAWTAMVRDAAPAGPRLASVLVDAALEHGPPREDLLAVVIRERADRRNQQRIS